MSVVAEAGRSFEAWLANPALTSLGGPARRFCCRFPRTLAAPPRDLTPGTPRGEPITIELEGRPVPAFAGEPVAVALHAAGIDVFARSPKYHRPRGVFCLEGHCASCTMRIDGRPNMRACVTPARAGLTCQRQNAFPSADVDLLSAADRFFPRGMDHHTLMTGTRVTNELFVKLVRQMGGSGTLPDSPVSVLPESTERTVDLCIVGAGPAGLSAARVVAEAVPGAAVVVYDAQSAPGGSLLAEPGGVARGEALAAAARLAGAEVILGATALGFYPEDEGEGGRRGLLAVVGPHGLERVAARSWLYATGAYDQNLPFADNDRPGILSARGCGRLAFRWGVRPGRRVVVVGGAPYAGTLAAGLSAAEVEAEVVAPEREQALRAAGQRRVRSIELGATPSGDGRRIVQADVVAVAATPAPASELPRQHGAEVSLDLAGGGFAVRIDARFATTAAGVHACGDVTGYVGPAAAGAAGRAAGEAMAVLLARTG